MTRLAPLRLLKLASRIAQPHGKLIITGVANPARFEWTPLYFKEIEIIGSNGFRGGGVSGTAIACHADFLTPARAEKN